MRVIMATNQLSGHPRAVQLENNRWRHVINAARSAGQPNQEPSVRSFAECRSVHFGVSEGVIASDQQLSACS